MQKFWKYLIIALLLAAVTVWTAVFTFPEKNFRLITCDVGQGDATLAILGNIQILIDGGPNSKVIECLSRYIPFWDRDIEIVMLSHPQTDHYTGLIEVFKRYKVNYFLANSLDSSSQSYQLLKTLVGGSDTKIVNPTAGTVLRYGLIRLDILNPPLQFLADNGSKIKTNDSGVLGAYTSKVDPNEFSIVAVLSYKDFNALFTGDIDNKISDEVADEISINYKKPLEYIKVPHHGSKNGLTKKLLSAVNPEVAVISAGKNNSYGHPHKEILDMLYNFGINILRTDQIGDIDVETNGKDYWFK